jgi:putative endonuclease
MKPGFTDILSNKGRTTFYIGITNDLRTRLYQHRFENGSLLRTKYGCFDLVYYEFFEDIEDAITREKQLNPDFHKLFLK